MKRIKHLKKNKTMKKVFLALTAIALLSCGATEKEPVNGTSKEITETKEKKENGDEVIKRGVEFSTEEYLTTEMLKTMLEMGDSAKVVLKGNVKAVCKKKGCWMTMPMDNETDIRVRFKDYGFFVPLNCEDKTAYVHGVATKNVISVDEQKHYAEDNGDSQEKIDAITEPKVEYSFLADGVMLM